MIYYDLFLAFSKIGLFGFGGGAAMLPVIYEAAKSLGTMDKGEFANLIGISQRTPWPIAVNAATYVGYSSAGLGGALMATFAVALPSFILVTLASYFLLRFKESRMINGILAGVRPMTAGLVLSAVFLMGQQAVVSAGGTEGVICLAICVASFALTAAKRFSPIIIMIMAGVIGALFMS